MAVIKRSIEIEYDLLQSYSAMDRKKGEFLCKRGDKPVGHGTVTYVGRDHVTLSGHGYTGQKRIPIGAIL